MARKPPTRAHAPAALAALIALAPLTLPACARLARTADGGAAPTKDYRPSRDGEPAEPPPTSPTPPPVPPPVQVQPGPPPRTR